MKKLLLAAGIALSAVSVNAANYSAWAIPKQVELVNGGLLIQGAFGDPNKCGLADNVFIARENTEYFNSVYSMALAALVGQKEMRIYTSQCTSLPFHGQDQTVNKHQEGHAIYIR